MVSFDVNYCLVWVALITRTALTSYMNVKFSRELTETNREFAIVFDESSGKVVPQVAENLREEQARARAARLHKFYEYYADQELTRIITSFIKDKSRPDGGVARDEDLSDNMSRSEVMLNDERRRFIEQVERQNNEY